MGFNISGLVINRNLKDQLDILKRELNWNLKFQKEIDFETASGNWKDDGLCDIYFSEKGTLIFINMEMCTDALPLSDANTLTFVLSEMSMAFNLNYCEGLTVKRSIMEVEGNRMMEDGEALPVEAEAEDTSEIIWKQLAEVLGTSFWDIDTEEKAYRYQFV